MQDVDARHKAGHDARVSQGASLCSASKFKRIALSGAVQFLQGSLGIAHEQVEAVG
jgi:hypothetical protein